MLLQRLIAEQITSRVIRLKNYFDPSVRPAPFQPRKIWMPEKLPPAELPGLRFKDSDSSKIGRLTSNVAMLRPLNNLRYERDVPESLKGIEGQSGCVPEIRV